MYDGGMIGAPTEEIKARLDIVEFIQSYVRLQKAGVNFRAPCPFHAEKTPSFFVSPARQIWHCFGGCGEGGDIFKFVMKMEGLDFPEALRLLAGRAGVQLRREDPRIASERNRLYDICEEAAKTFEKNLLLSAAPKEYLKKRGVTENTVRGFRIGFSPESWDFLLSRLAKKGFKNEEAEKAGLAIRSEDGRSWHDRFRSRIMFPITDANGRVIGFGGRIFGPTAEIVVPLPKSPEMDRQSAESSGGDKSPVASPLDNVGGVKTGRGITGMGTAPSTTGNIGSGMAKYINTPQTMIYDKSRVLYGFDKAKQEIRAQNQAVIVEGYMDCVLSHQAGVKNTIAVSGTALTPLQLKILKRLCDTIVSSFDADAAGEAATRRSLALAAEFEFERKIAVIPAGKDPADAVLESPAQWIAAVTGARPVIDFYFDKLFREENSEHAEGKKKISAVLIPLIADLPDEIQKAHWVRCLAKRFAMGEEVIWKEVLRRPDPSADARAGVHGAGQATDVGNSDAAPAAPSRRQLLEDRFLSLVAILPDEKKEAALANHRVEFQSASGREIFSFLAAVSRDMPPHLAPAAHVLRFKGEAMRELGGDAEQELAVCGRELEKACVRDRLVRMGEEIRASEQTGNDTTVRLLEDFRSLSERLKALA